MCGRIEERMFTQLGLEDLEQAVAAGEADPQKADPAQKRSRAGKRWAHRRTRSPAADRIRDRASRDDPAATLKAARFSATTGKPAVAADPNSCHQA